jgi:hypothetical protein
MQRRILVNSEPLLVDAHRYYVERHKSRGSSFDVKIEHRLVEWVEYEREIQYRGIIVKVRGSNHHTAFEPTHWLCTPRSHHVSIALRFGRLIFLGVVIDGCLPNFIECIISLRTVLWFVRVHGRKRVLFLAVFVLLDECSNARIRR